MRTVSDSRAGRFYSRGFVAGSSGMGRASLAAASASSRRAWSTVWAASCSRRSASAILALASASIPAAFSSAVLRIRSASVLASDRSFCARSRLSPILLSASWSIPCLRRVACSICSSAYFFASAVRVSALARALPRMVLASVSALSRMALRSALAPLTMFCMSTPMCS